MSPATALVLSGGGARGAYEVGVLEGTLEVLGVQPGDPPPFQIFTGTSVGAINAVFLASQAQYGDLGVPRLKALWSELTLLEDLRVDPFRLLGLERPEWLRRADRPSTAAGRAVLRAEPLDRIIRREIAWDQLHQNIHHERVKACIVAALRMDSGRTTLFIEQSPQTRYASSPDPRREAITTALTADHVLASASIPFVFPPRRIGAHLYADGGLRFNTPIAPAIRAGAERLFVVTVRYRGELHPEAPVPPEDHDRMAFLLGKLFNALLLDPLDYDLQVLERFNRLMDVLTSTLPPDRMAKVEQALGEMRGQPYRHLKTLVFHPSQDLGAMANSHAQTHGLRTGSGLTARFKERGLASLLAKRSDLGSFLLFDGSYTRRLIELGRQDALARRTAIRAFFGVL